MPSGLNLPRNNSRARQRPHACLATSIDLEWRLYTCAHLRAHAYHLHCLMQSNNSSDLRQSRRTHLVTCAALQCYMHLVCYRTTSHNPIARNTGTSKHVNPSFTSTVLAAPTFRNPSRSCSHKNMITAHLCTQVMLQPEGSQCVGHRTGSSSWKLQQTGTHSGFSHCHWKGTWMS